MASPPEITLENPQVAPIQFAPPRVCGGPSDAREMVDNEQALFEQYRDIIEPKIREQFNVPANFPLQPTKVHTQVVAGTNYYFHVPLPNGQFAHVKVFKPLRGHALEKGDRTSFVTVQQEAKNE